MDALEVLKEEHAVILEITEVLNNLVKKLQAKEKVPPEQFEKILDVMHNFVDKCHHGKEEMALFPLISEHGGREAKAVSLLIEEHEKGRALVRGLSDAIVRNDTIGIIKNANDYVGLLAQHIKKENVVFPTWINSLSDETKRVLFKRFEEIDEQAIGLGKHQEYVKTVEKLKKIL
jgi:hemerythrin-like domain-containing protein